MLKNSKIIFVGLDNAGKTSILTTLNKKYNYIEDIKKLKPTIKIERSSFKFLNTEIYNHDFGGQKSFREEYLNYKDRFFVGTDLMFYVVDVQDENRYKESFEYFDEIAKYFKEQKFKLPIIVLFHKFDPELANDEKLIFKIIDLKKLFNEWLPYHHLYYFNTSIYNLYSIIEAFSFALSKIFGKHEIIDAFLQRLGESFNALSCILFEENGLEIGCYFKPHLEHERRKQLRNIFIEAEKKLIQSKEDSIEFSNVIGKDSDKFTRVSGVLIRYLIGFINFYLLFVIEEKSEEDTIAILDKLEKYKPELNDIIQSIISEPEPAI
ncbi:MAG: ADP-ribosylation factor-like protein [Promethearchaeota archaeon]